MQPNEPHDKHNQNDDSASQQAAINLVRSQIDRIYGGASELEPEQPTATNPVPITNTSPYERTHQEHPQPSVDQWQKYHTAWQEYYQKYYEGYYTHHLHKTKKALEERVAQAQPLISTSHPQPHNYFSNQPREDIVTTEKLSENEAVFDLRQRLLAKIRTSASKVRKSRHFVPITAAVIVVFVFLFLQYNRLVVSNVMAYVSPGKIDPQNIIIEPGGAVAVGPEPRLIIPKINVDVPVVYGIGNDQASQLSAMDKGVAHFAIPGASSRPGQVGNTVIAGHSSNDLFDNSQYKFIFAQLERLSEGDMVYAHYEGIRYAYTITQKEVVKPNDVSKLVYPTDKPVMTLVTCTPVGTALNRLLVTAEQISPDTNASRPAPVKDGKEEEAVMPGNSPTIFERLFGGNWEY